MSALRITVAAQRAGDLDLLLPVAAWLEAEGAEVTLAAVGRGARAALAGAGRAHAAPDDTGWFFDGAGTHLIVMPLAPPESGGLLRQIAGEAGRRGVPTLAVESDPGRPAFEIFPAHLALSGGASYGRALAAGWSDERIAISGCPLFDADENPMARAGAASAGTERSAGAAVSTGLTGTARSRIVIVSSFPFAARADRDAFIDGLASALGSFGGARVEIASSAGGRDIAPAAGELVARLVVAGIDAAALDGGASRRAISCAALVITEDLSAALHALAAGVPVVAIDWPHHPTAPGEARPPIAAGKALVFPDGYAASPARAGVAARAALESRRPLREWGNARARASAFVEPGPPSARERIGRLALRLADARRAQAQATRARIARANERLSAGATGEAAAAYREILADDATNAAALTNLGLVLAARREAADALRVFSALLELEPGNVTAHVAASRILAGNGDSVGAIQFLESLLDRRPDPQVAALLAETYLAAGLAEQAVEMYDAADAAGALTAAGRAERERAASLAGLPMGETARDGATDAASDAADRTGAAPRLSIVIVAYNSADDLPDCLDAIARATRTPHEVIVVDNGSSDGTRALLHARLGITLAESDENLGYSAGANLGLEHARGEAVVFLNPDTVVTAGWDERMLAHVAPGVGAVGPLSNYVAGQQKLELHAMLPPGQLPIDDVARIVAARNAGRGLDTKLLIGFCLLITSEALDAVGRFDPALFLGNDDLDYSLRLRRAGLRLVVATDAFVYHKGQRSFQSEPSERTARLVQESTDRLQEKLERIYGAGRVPSSDELWGIGWFRPSRRAAAAVPKTSIVILTMNELAYTKKCVESIAAHTPEAHEIVFVDNGSTDGTPAWLDTLAKNRGDVRVIKNAANRGFAGGANQGIRAATGERILLLNNDVVVTEGWLGGLARHLDADPRAGLVGPVSNYVSGAQLDPTAAYDSLDAMAEHAHRTSRERIGESEETRRLVGFCLLARAEVFRAIGLFDEGFAVGNFEDDDLSMRAVLGGWRLVIAKDVFVHHFGSRTFVGNRINYRDALDRNKAYFVEKWRGVVAGAFA